LAVVFASVLLAGAVPGLADAACPSNLTSNPFAQFGDNAAYYPAPGGSFESGAPGWSLSRAAIVNGNESFGVEGGSHSLGIEPNGVAASPWICVSSEYPSFRLFVRQLSGPSGASLKVSVRLISLLGVVSVNTTAAWVQNGSSWAPGPVLQLGSSVPAWLPGSSLELQLVFQPSGGASWAIDDVYIDPYRR
jgi:hypothetical protein